MKCGMLINERRYSGTVWVVQDSVSVQESIKDDSPENLWPVEFVSGGALLCHSNLWQIYFLLKFFILLLSIWLNLI